MRSHEHRLTSFDSPSAKLLHWRQYRRWLRNALLVVLALVMFVEWIGEPMLRWEYRYRGQRTSPSITDATYIGLSGRLEAYAHQYAEGCPLIVFVKPCTPLWRQAIDWVTAPSPTPITP